jgi:hypothetical protein
VAATGAAASSGAAPDPLAVADEWEAAATPITDEAINNACAKRNAEIKKPTLIRELVGRYLPGGVGTAKQIPAEKRAAFLLELEKLS